MAWNDYPLTDEEWAEIEQGLAARAAKPEQSLPEAVPAWAVWGQRLGWVLLPVTLRVMATRGQSEGQRLST
ncbi:MAG TPA: hypothetical protein VEI97_07475, partial [bacterium]|nr:hypothetical protein [bacterium]